MLRSNIKCEKCDYIKFVPSEKLKHNTKLKCPKCNSIFNYNKNIYFVNKKNPEFDKDEYIHPWDREALKTLKRVPGVGPAIKLLMKYAIESFIRIDQMGDNIKVTEKTCGYIYDMGREAANILNLSPPTIYLDQTPYVNAYTTCVDKPIIVLQSGLIELCDDDELFAVIAHEMGHIKCEHVMYHMLADCITMLPSLFGVGDIITMSLKVALLDWRRKSELTADRFAFLVTKNKEKIVTFLMKAAGGSSKLNGMICFDDFSSQYAEWQKLMDKNINRMANFVASIGRSHPFAVIRAHEIDSWSKSLENK